MSRQKHRFPTRLFLLLPLLAGVGCETVPQVESRLESMRFYPNMYVVQAGDTLETIAWRYELAAADVAALNPDITGENLVVGQRINVRPGTELTDAVRNRTVTRPSVRSASNDGSAWGGAPRAADGLGRQDEPPVVVTPVNTTASLPPHSSWYEPARQAAALPDARRATDGFRADDELLPVAVADGNLPREEIVPDDLDDPILRTETARATLDDDLRGYVGRWTWPIEGAVARGFAPGQPGGQGVDIAGVPGQDVRAALGGTVVYSGRDLSEGGGRLVIVRHDDELMTTYSHADQLYVAENDEVLAGDPIASLGTNGRSESVLRFEVRQGGSPLDPLAFLPPTR